MSGKFIDTSYNETIDSLVGSMKELLKNPYYMWSDKTATSCTYWNINSTKSTLDEGSRLTYSDIGIDSSIKFNKIKNFMLYGLDQVTVELERDEFGIESGPIESEAIILPNTIEPTPNDLFSINYLNEDILFRVTEVNFDTLDNGSNLYRIKYKLEKINDLEKMEAHTSETFVMITKNVGTNYSSVIREECYDFLDYLDKFLVQLKKYYKTLFYSSRVQTFIFKYLGRLYYDPYMIEFLINNKILEGDDEYIHIMHQTRISGKFPIEYNKTFLSCVEKKDLCNLRRYKYNANCALINEFNTIFDDRIEPYYQINYEAYLPQIASIPCFLDDLMDHIEDDTLFDKAEDYNFLYYNIIVKYFNNEEITQDDLDVFEMLDYEQNVYLYYALPVVIFCLENKAKNILANNYNPNM